MPQSGSISRSRRSRAISGAWRRTTATLFQRKPTLRLTAEGEALATCARQLQESEGALTRRLADITKNASAVLTFDISYQRSGVFFPGIWNQFHNMHPNINVRLHERTTDKLLDELQSNRIDLMVGLDIAGSTSLTDNSSRRMFIHFVLQCGICFCYFFLTQANPSPFDNTATSVGPPTVC